MTDNRHLIEIKGIGKDYLSQDVAVKAIKNMDFVIDDGEFVSIIGQSGSGKSTLLSIIGGLNHPTRGKVFVDTLDLYSLSSEQRADFRSEYIGIIFQNFNLLQGFSALENVLVGMTFSPASRTSKKPNICWMKSGFPIDWTISHPNCLRASSKGWPWPEPWQIDLNCCWRMNRQHPCIRSTKKMYCGCCWTCVTGTGALLW